VGRIVTTVALGFFLGPAAASFLGASSVAGVAAVSGFVGSAGSTLLAGGNLKDALKAGAIGGVTAGAIGGVTQGFNTAYTGPTTVGGQVDAFKGMLPGGTPAAPTAPTGPAPTDLAQAPGGAPVPDAAQFGIGDPGAGFESAAPGFDATASQGSLAKVAAPTETSLVDQAKDFYSKNISPSGIKQAGAENAILKVQEQFPGVSAAEIAAAPAGSPMALAYKSAMPGIMGTYGPAVGVGLGIMGLTGGFKADSGQGITAEDRKGPTERIREEGSQKQYFVQGLPGVKYDQFGEPVYGESTPFTTRDPYFSNSSNFALPSTIGGVQGVAPPMAVYNTPTGAMGSRQVAQPYNNANMYSNLMAPQRYADGGQVQYFSDGGNAAKLPANFNWEQYVAANPDLGRAGIDTQAEAQEHWLNNGLKENRALNPEEGAQRERARLATLAEQEAARAEVARQKQMRRAAGSGNMYANINAGLSALAPEANPMDAADTTFGARNRGAQLANLQQTYGPMLQNQRNAMNQQSAALGQPAPNLPSPYTAAPPVDRYSQMVQDQYARIGRTGFGDQTSQIDVPGFNNFVSHLQDGRIRPEDLSGRFDTAVQDYMREKPDDRYTKYVQEFQRGQERPITTMPVTPPPAGQLPGMGNFDPFYQQWMALDAQVNARNSQGQKATPEQMAEMRRLSELSENDPGVNARRDALNKEAMERGIFYTQGAGTPGMTPGQIANTPGMGMAGIGMNFPGLDGTRIPGEGPGLFGNTTGIASLAEGGYPRRNGQISGPGTEKSDSIPAMLSDGEFVMTAKAVRGAGKGSRRAGAKQMYKLMHQLEKNAERG
jgi:hypothetical protein